MREIRSSGSVEGVISDGHSYSDSTGLSNDEGWNRHLHGIRGAPSTRPRTGCTGGVKMV
jgi:hypothetical protein